MTRGPRLWLKAYWGLYGRLAKRLWGCGHQRAWLWIRLGNLRGPL